MDYLINNGHTVKAVLENGKVSVGGGGLEHVYSTLQFHFHWGNSSEHGLGSTSASQPHRSSSSGSASASSSGSSSSDQGSTSSSSEGGSKVGGSEHALDSHVYPMEMHIVSMRTDLTQEDALKDQTGFIVLGFFIQEIDDDNDGDKYTQEVWKNFTDHLEMIKNIGSTIELHHDISLDALIGSVDRTKYYRYSGSLTTPSCNEAVIWTIFKEPIKVKRNLVKKFPEHTGLNNVFRSVQSLHSREVYTTVSSSPPACLLSVLLILCALITCLGINQTQ